MRTILKTFIFVYLFLMIDDGTSKGDNAFCSAGNSQPPLPQSPAPQLTPRIRIQKRNIQKLPPPRTEVKTSTTTTATSNIETDIEANNAVFCKELADHSEEGQLPKLPSDEDHFRNAIKILQTHTHKSFHLVVWALFYESGSILQAYLLLAGRKEYPSWNCELDFEILEALQQHFGDDCDDLDAFYSAAPLALTKAELPLNRENRTPNQIKERSVFLFKLTRFI